MPLPEQIKPKNVVYVVYTKLGPLYVKEDKDDAKKLKQFLEKSGGIATIRKYSLHKELKKEEHESQDLQERQ